MNSINIDSISQSTPQRIIKYIKSRGQSRAYDLEKELQLSNVTIHKQLKKLLKSGELQRIGTPPYVLYTLSNTANPSLVQLEKIKRKVSPILKQASIKQAALFGSYVRGDNNKDSDIDILVELPENASLFELAGLKIDLEEKLKRKVDVVTYRSICPLIKDSILRNQYPLL